MALQSWEILTRVVKARWECKKCSVIDYVMGFSYTNEGFNIFVFLIVMRYYSLGISYEHFLGVLSNRSLRINQTLPLCIYVVTDICYHFRKIDVVVGESSDVRIIPDSISLFKAAFCYRYLNSCSCIQSS